MSYTLCTWMEACVGVRLRFSHINAPEDGTTAPAVRRGRRVLSPDAEWTRGQCGAWEVPPDAPAQKTKAALDREDARGSVALAAYREKARRAVRRQRRARERERERRATRQTCEAKENESDRARRALGALSVLGFDQGQALVPIANENAEYPGALLADRRLYLTSERVLVSQSHPAGRVLLAPKGRRIRANVVTELGLVADANGRVTQNNEADRLADRLFASRYGEGEVLVPVEFTYKNLPYPGSLVADRRLYLTLERVLVSQSHSAGKILLARKGRRIRAKIVAELRLVADEDGRITQVNGRPRGAK